MKKLIFTLSGLFLALNLSAQTTFEKLIGGQAFTAGECVIETQSKEYVVTGQLNDQGFGGKADLYLVKTDSLGDTLWTRSFGEADDDFGNSVVETTDGGYAACGTTRRFNGTAWQVDAYLIRTNANGDSIWTRHYGGNQTDQAFCIRQTFDDGFILVGSTESFGNPSGEAYLIRTDMMGDTLWTRKYKEGYSNRAFSVEQTADGGFILCGRSLSSGSGTDADLYMLRTDVNGDSIWAKTFGGTGFEEGNSVVITPDLGFLSAGYTQNNASGDKDIYLVKTDASGFLNWSKSIGGPYPEEALSLTNAPGGGFLMAGTRIAPPSWYTDLFVLKVDAMGDTLWTRTYGGSFIDAGKSIQPTSDGGIIIAGFSNSFGVSDLKLYLLKADADGVVSRELPFLSGPVTLYPNPLSAYSVLSVPVELTGRGARLEILDLAGRQVREAVEIREGETPVGPEGLEKGVYLYRVVEGEMVLVVGRVLVF